MKINKKKLISMISENNKILLNLIKSQLPIYLKKIDVTLHKSTTA